MATCRWNPTKLVFWLGWAFLSVVVLTGCWDRIELERRGLVLVMALDADKEGQVLTGGSSAGGEGERPRFLVSLQLIEPTQLAGGTEAGGKASREPFWTASIADESIAMAFRGFNTRWYRFPLLEHLKTLVIGEELAREGLGSVMDFLTRDREMRRQTDVLIADGRGKEVIDIRHRLQPNLGLYFPGLMEHDVVTLQMAPTFTIGDLVAALHAEEDFLAPRVILDPDRREVKLSGGAVFKQGRMAGWLDEDEVLAARWVLNQVEEGELKLTCPGGDNGLLVFHVQRAQTRLRPHVENGPRPQRVVMNIVVRAEGEIDEDTCPAVHTLDPDALLVTEESINRDLNERIISIVTKVQREFGADIFNFGEMMRRYQPAVWREVAPRWGDFFPLVEIRPQVQVKIRRFGISK